MKLQSTIIQALKQKDPFNSLVRLLSHQDTEVKEEAAKKLYKLGGNKSIQYLLSEAKKTSDMSIYLELACLCECSGHEMELLRIGLASDNDAKDCVLYALTNIKSIKISEKNKLLAAINLQRQLLKTENIININNIYFLNEASDLIEEIDIKEPAQIIQFPRKKLHLVK